MADVAEAVKLARALDLDVAVRGGGHNVAGHATLDHDLLIDLSPMKGIHVDVRTRTVRAEGGVNNSAAVGRASVMSDTKFVRAATLDRIGDFMDDTAGVHLRDLPPFTTLLVWTMNSLYRVVVTHWPEVFVQGGAFFPDPTLACVDGASIGGSCLRVGWIGAGLLVEFARDAGTSSPRYLLSVRDLPIVKRESHEFVWCTSPHPPGGHVRAPSS